MELVYLMHEPFERLKVLRRTPQVKKYISQMQKLRRFAYETMNISTLVMPR
jgi:hypothetical protein